ncbi:unnamed protein product [Eruca vesicaria subsp. sativa]|uniref:Ribosomal protein L31 n=1 Tax=Eruca vesicaria subsp. sativa TaxID=29727 RepID=A0ABC8LQ50_ERUVS|nr:unnamed protein product [Eruca vesicaria subsp. sativa]CAH8385558.1 unnamed protein product [Eruca vesicaria subsp. sativa]
MSCLRITPVKRVWKSLTTKFHKLRISKTKIQTRYGASASRHPTEKNLGDRDSSVLFLIRLKRGCLLQKKRKSVVYVDKLFREPIWIPAKQWKPKEELVPEKGIDERAQEFINRMKAEMIAARNS